ncbi:MAG: hypothetical protein PVJ62_00055, partial [Deltaproteobacteria bacterium]
GASGWRAGSGCLRYDAHPQQARHLSYECWHQNAEIQAGSPEHPTAGKLDGVTDFKLDNKVSLVLKNLQ